ncbi:MAG: hypothetical protein U1D55_00605 [Phycisphaerae bacterium]
MQRSRSHSHRHRALSTLLLLGTATAAAQSYRIRELPPLSPTGESFGIGINESGVVVGQGRTSTGTYSAIRWIAGAPVEFDPAPTFSTSIAFDVSNDGRFVGRSGASCGSTVPSFWENDQLALAQGAPRMYAEVYRINDTGVAVGEALDSCSRPWNDSGYEWRWDSQSSAWVITPLLPLTGDPETGAYDLNDAGVIVGFSGNSGSAHLRAVRWDNGTPSLLPDLGGDYSIAAGINSIGQVAGYSRTSSGAFRAYFFNGAIAINLGTFPGYAYSAATRVNNAGTVIGHVFNTPGEATVWPYGFPDASQRAFIWRNGVFSYPLNLIAPGSGWSTLNGLRDINERGQITGYGVRNGLNRGFLLTPECIFHGDLNNDGFINEADLGIVLASWDCAAPSACLGDVDGDGDTDSSDLGILLAAFGTTCP